MNELTIGSYRITTRDGSTLRTAEHFEVALTEMKEMPKAVMVVRASDGVILAYRTTPKLTTRKRGRA